MKRFFAIFLVLVMMLSLSASALAVSSPVELTGDMLADSFANYETAQASASARNAYNAALCDLVEDYLLAHELTLHFATYASTSSIGISMEPVGSDINAFMDAFVKNSRDTTRNSAFVVYIKSTNEYCYRLSFAEGSDIAVDWAAVGAALKGEGSDLARVKSAFEVIAEKEAVNKTYYADALIWAKAKGIVGTDFSMESVCTRGEAAMFMWLAFGGIEFPSGDISFLDVPETSEYYKAVTWAYRVGATTGISATEFAPNGVCTRAQVVTMLWRVMGKPIVTQEVKMFGESFSDVAQSDYYADAVMWASVKGITNGTGGGLFSPDGECTQIQIITFLYRLLGDM